jgi:Transglycosylase SLT domain
LLPRTDQSSARSKPRRGFLGPGATWAGLSSPPWSHCEIAFPSETVRNTWEPWHFGAGFGPAPCSAAGNSVGPKGDGLLSGKSLPSFVPSRFRDPILRAAAHWNVSAALLAAQLMAESNFNPFAVSPAGAQGIAQFIPSTAAAYGLDDPFDPVAAIEAQAHLMSDLIRQLGSPQLALAAYNAGPAPVEACHCVPTIPETTVYVSRILALLGGTGALVVPSFEVRLVA